MTDSVIDSNLDGATLADEAALADVVIAEMQAASYAQRPMLECDMIMKGGITSGVVYPLTVCKLATRYRLKGIGGTSAGAIAAALAAAAEYHRRDGTTDPDLGFRKLAELPDEIAKNLETLFQPQAKARKIFAVLKAGIDPEHQGLARALRIVGTIIRGQVGWFLVGMLLVLGVVLPGLVITTGFPIGGADWWRIVAGLFLPTLFAIVVGILFAAVGLAIYTMRTLPEIDFGLTSGATYPALPDDEPGTRLRLSKVPGLTEWLAYQIDQVAGITDREKCLTLGNLWGEEAVTSWAAAVGAKSRGPVGELKRMRLIDLEVMTTDLTVRRPFRLPFSDQTFLFDKKELGKLFPKRVIDTMATCQSHHLSPAGERLYYFPGPGRSSEGKMRPGPDQLPLVVMARMSLSFPGLISPVPLYAVDHNGDQSVVRHLFSDGGISSNFPMHFFDSLLPRRPTFGINLAAPHPSHPAENVWRAHKTLSGVIPRAQPFDSIGGFAGALRDTIQNWADNRQITQRGYADRVVEIRLGSNEGGMNLAMPPHVVKRLVVRGALAGDLLLGKDPRTGNERDPGFDWEAHRAIRYRIAMSRLNDALEAFRFAYGQAAYASLIADYPETKRMGSTYVKSPFSKEADISATNELIHAIDAWDEKNWPALKGETPSPAPVVRLAPE